MIDIRDHGAVSGKSDPESLAINDAAIIAALPSTWYGDGRDLGDRTVYVPAGDWHFGKSLGRERYDGEGAGLPAHLPGSSIVFGDGPCSRLHVHADVGVRLAHYTSGSQYNTDVVLRDLSLHGSGSVGVDCLCGSRMELDSVHLIGWACGWSVDGAQHVRARSLRVQGPVGVRVGATSHYQANAWVGIDGAELLCEVGVDIVGAVAFLLRRAYASGGTLARVGSVTGLVLDQCGTEASTTKAVPLVDVVGNVDSLSVLGGVYACGVEGRCLVRLATGKVLRGLILDGVSVAAPRGPVVEDPGGGVRGIQHRAVLIATRPDGTTPPLYAGPQTVAALDVAGDVACRSAPGAMPYMTADGALGRSFVAQRSGMGVGGVGSSESSREVRSLRTEPGQGVEIAVPLMAWESATVEIVALSSGYDEHDAASWRGVSTWTRGAAVTGEGSMTRQGAWPGADAKVEPTADGVRVVLPAHTKRRNWQIEIAVVRRPWSP